MPVVSIFQRRDHETKELLSSLKVIADHMGGSVLTVYRSPDGWERVYMTGVFRSDPAQALRAAMRISITLTKEEEAVRGRP